MFSKDFYVTKPIKVLLSALVGLLAIGLIALLLLLYFFDINRHKPAVEERISSALGMQATVEGPLRLSLRPGLRITLQKVRVRNRDTEFAFIEEVDVAIPFVALLHNDIVPSHIETRGVRITVERSPEGRYNYEKLPAEIERSRAVALVNLAFEDVSLVYSDQSPNDRLAFTGCSGEFTNIQKPAGEPFLKHLSLNGQFKCNQLQGPGPDKNRVVTNLQVTATAKAGVLDFDPITVLAYGGQGTAKIRTDRSLDVPTLTIAATLPKFRVESLLQPAASGKALSGQLNFSANLSMRGADRLVMRQSAQGGMSLSGANLKLSGVDLDQQLKTFELSQSLNLLDIGALLFVGPISLIATKGAELATVTRSTDSSTVIRNAIARWKIEKGVAHAVDVALTTNANRLAIRGDLNFVNEQYRDVVVALVDDNGCAKARQKISGPFSKPVVEQSIILVPLGPLLRLLESAQALLKGGPDKCEVFYSGSLTSPK